MICLEDERSVIQKVFKKAHAIKDAEAFLFAEAFHRACELGGPDSNGLPLIPRWPQVEAVHQLGCVSIAVFQQSDYAVEVCSVAVPISIGLSR